MKTFLVATAAVLALGASAGGAKAALTVTGMLQDGWTAETGQSMPTNAMGFVDGILSSTDNQPLTFMYGTSGLAIPPGQTGHGNSIDLNEFWVGSSEAAAEAAGHVFCTQASDTSCGGVASHVGDTFTVPGSAGAVAFGFTFGATHSSILLNGTPPDGGAYLATTAPITLDPTHTSGANPGPSDIAYLGLSDSPYSGPGGDHDFEDMVVQVSVPEPATLAVLGIGLAGLGLIRRRKIG